MTVKFLLNTERYVVWEELVLPFEGHMWALATRFFPRFMGLLNIHSLQEMVNAHRACTCSLVVFALDYLPDVLHYRLTTSEFLCTGLNDFGTCIFLHELLFKLRITIFNWPVSAEEIISPDFGLNYRMIGLMIFYYVRHGETQNLLDCILRPFHQLCFAHLRCYTCLALLND